MTLTCKTVGWLENTNHDILQYQTKKQKKHSQYISAGRKQAWHISNLSSDLESKKPSHPYFKMRINICVELQYYLTLSNIFKLHIVLLSDIETTCSCCCATISKAQETDIDCDD